MAIEIERKYLVTSMKGVELPPGVSIRQGYLSTDPTVRVRIKGERGFLTVKCDPKSEKHHDAIERQEFEYEIPVPDAESMLGACGACIKKMRHVFLNGVELDVFAGRHAGLILAEFESNDGSHAPIINGMIWTEVTSNKQFSNSWLCINGMPDLKTFDC